MAKPKTPKRPAPPSILDPGFRYTPSTATDVRKTFARIRREMAKNAREAAGVSAPVPSPLPEAPATVLRLRKPKP